MRTSVVRGVDSRGGGEGQRRPGEQVLEEPGAAVPGRGQHAHAVGHHGRRHLRPRVR